MKRTNPIAALAVLAALAILPAHGRAQGAPGKPTAHDSTAMQAAPAAPAKGAAVAAPAGDGTIDGIWMFDAKRSDDPRKIMEANRPSGGGRGPGGGGMRGGMGGGMGGGGRHGGGAGGWGGRGGAGGEASGENEGDRAPGAEAGNGEQGAQRPGGNPMERVMRPPQKVVIELQTDKVTVVEDERVTRDYALQDSLKAHEHDLVTEGTTASWKAGRLMMTQTLGQRGSLVETYELSKDGKTLTIRAHREGGREGMPNPTFARVYTRYEGD